MKSHFAGVVLLILAVWVAPAQSEEADSWAYAVSREIMSPFCPGRTLADCPSPQADNLRIWIRLQEAAGRSRADVEAELYERYGDMILAAPRAEGIGLAVYLVPGLAFLAGGLVVVVFLRRHTRQRSEPSPRPIPTTTDAELERLVDEELAQ